MCIQRLRLSRVETENFQTSSIAPHKLSIPSPNVRISEARNTLLRGVCHEVLKHSHP